MTKKVKKTFADRDMMTPKHRCTIIIPTVNNVKFLMAMLESLMFETMGWYDFFIVNQGSEKLYDELIFSDKHLSKLRNLQYLHVPKPVGWVGAINLALANNSFDNEFFLFLNDDVLFIPGQHDWLNNMVATMVNDPIVGAVGPCSNFVAGWQGMRHAGLPHIIQTQLIIGFCMLLRRSTIEEIGPLDPALPGGDDLDYSIRLTTAGYKLVCRRDCFVYHYGQVTGKKPEFFGKDYDSPAMSHRTNTALIKKHGFKKFWNCISSEPRTYTPIVEEYNDGNFFRQIVQGEGLDVGCGHSKEPGAKGVDARHNSDADIICEGDDLSMADETQDFIVARHIIEHFTDPMKALTEWNRVLKKGGKVGISTPDADQYKSKADYLEHKHY